jgi:hypothetical protein
MERLLDDQTDGSWRERETERQEEEDESRAKRT